jgi:hypothetical protein
MTTLVIPIVLALVGALVSFVGMILAKEQKISEFRQSWLDALRSDIASLEARILAIHAAHSAYRASCIKAGLDPVEAGNDPAFVEKTKDDYLEINQASVRIRLRLNPEDQSHGRVISLMNDTEKQFKIGDPAETPFEAIDKLTTDITNASQKLLKDVWEEVKAGEPTFKKTKRIAFWIAIAASALLVFMVAFQIWRSVHPLPLTQTFHRHFVPL